MSQPVKPDQVSVWGVSSTVAGLFSIFWNNIPTRGGRKKNKSPPLAKIGESSIQPSTLPPASRTSPPEANGALIAAPPASRPHASNFRVVQNLGYNLFWGTLTLPMRFKSALMDGGKDMAKREVTRAIFQEIVGNLVTPEPNTPLKSFRNCLQTLFGAVSSNIEITQQMRRDASGIIDDFLANEKKYLKDARNPKTSCWGFRGFRASPDYVTEDQFTALSAALKAGQPLDNHAVKQLYDLVESWWKLEQQFHVGELTDDLTGRTAKPVFRDRAPLSVPPLGSVASSEPAGIAPAADSPPPSSPGIAARVVEQLHPAPQKDPVPDIIRQMDELKSVGFKLLLAFLILPKSCFEDPLPKKEGDSSQLKDAGRRPTRSAPNRTVRPDPSLKGQDSDEQTVQKKDGDTGLLAELIKTATDSVHSEKNSNELFQDFIMDELDNADLNPVQRTWKKFCCILLAPTILFVLDHLLEKIKNDLLFLIGLKPEERLEYIVKMAINPGLGFINKLKTFYLKFSKDPSQFSGTLEEERSYELANLVVQDRNRKNLTPKQLIGQLIGALINRYSPTFDWAATSAEYFDSRSAQATRFEYKIWFYGWARVSQIYYVLSWPFTQCLYKAVRKIVKITATSIISSKLIDSQESSWDFGKLALHSVYKTLLEKMREKKRGALSAGPSAVKINPAIKQTSFVDKRIQRDIGKLVSGFLKVLEYEGHDKDDIAAEENFFSQLKRDGKKLVYEPGIQKATEQIIEGLQIFLERESCSALISEVLTDVNRQCVHFNANNTKEGLAKVEKEFYEELKKALRAGLKQVIDEVRDPSRRIQQEADRFTEGLKCDIADFQSECHTRDPLSSARIKKLKETYDQNLDISFDRRYDRAMEATNPSTHVQIQACSEQFLGHRKPISDQLNRLLQLSQARKEAQERIARLQLLLAPLSKVEFPFTELQGALQRVKNKLYPPAVQARIAALQQAFQDNRTQTSKKYNESRLINVIELLRKAVEDTIVENNTSADRLATEIAGCFILIQQHAQQLADWARGLIAIKCLSVPQELDTVQKVLALLNKYAPQVDIEGKLSGIIIKQLEGFFDFLGKDHNIKGPLWFVIKAYLELPPRHDYEKVVGSVYPASVKSTKPA